MTGVFGKLLGGKKACDFDPRHGESVVVARIPGGRQVRACASCAKLLGYRHNA